MQAGHTPSIMALVEDDEAVLRALKFAFEAEGYIVHAFASAEAMLAEAPDGCVCFVLDLKLPGMSGLDLYDRLRANGQAAPAILITTHPPNAVLARAAAAGVQVVEKPLLGQALTEAVCAAAERFTRARPKA